MKQYLGMQFLQNSTFMKYSYKRKTLPLRPEAAGFSLSALYIPETRAVLNGSRFRMPAFPDAVQTGRMQPT